MRKFKEFNQLTEAVKYGSIDMKSVKTYEDALDPEVYTFGMGTYPLSMLKTRIAEILEDMADDMRTSMKNDKLQYGEQIQDKIDKRLKYFIGALADVEKQMKTPQYKRRTTMLKNKR